MKIRNKVPMYITVLLENGDKRVWLPLPATIERFNAAVGKIGARDSGCTVREYATKVPKLQRSTVMEAPLALVNYLASRLNKLNDAEILKLCAICDSEYYFSYVGEYIDYTFQTDNYTLLPGICDEEALGDYYIGIPGDFLGPPCGRRRVDDARAKMKQCIDRREFGRRLAALEDGAFTPHGYITSRVGWNLTPKERLVPVSLNIKGRIGENLYGDWEGNGYE